jgi:hypothetical protein
MEGGAPQKYEVVLFGFLADKHLCGLSAGVSPDEVLQLLCLHPRGRRFHASTPQSCLALRRYNITSILFSPATIRGAADTQGPSGGGGAKHAEYLSRTEPRPVAAGECR